MKLSLDEIDLKILKRLQENGKITNLQLSKE
ncbi:MAG TPA: AsnC family transcriptional regulator, partial [Flavobacteriales bacterium]|nr:AsnC family transcriptional regulator [Flavobacteriales bacterium]